MPSGKSFLSIPIHSMCEALTKYFRVWEKTSYILTLIVSGQVSMCYSRQVLKADRLRIQSSKSKAAAIGCSVISRGTAGLVTLAAASQTSWSWHNTEVCFLQVNRMSSKASHCIFKWEGCHGCEGLVFEPRTDFRSKLKWKRLVSGLSPLLLCKPPSQQSTLAQVCTG